MARYLRTLLAAALASAASLPSLAAVMPRSDEKPVFEEREKQRGPAAAVLNDGFVLAWEVDGGVMVRRFADDASNVGASAVAAESDPLPPLPFSATLREQWQPAVAARGDGPFLLAWTEQVVNRRVDIFIDSKHVVSSRVMVRLFDADATPIARPWEVSAPSGPSSPAC